MIAAGFGCLYEIYEWVSDMTFGTDHQPDNTDTMMDITANAGGGLIGGLWLAGWAAWRRPPGSRHRPLPVNRVKERQPAVMTRAPKRTTMLGHGPRDESAD